VAAVSDNPKQDDFQDLEDEYQSARSRLGTIAGVVIGLLVAGLLVVFFARAMGGNREEAARKMRIKQALSRFNADPTRDDYAQAAIAEFESQNNRGEADKIRARHDAALGEHDGKREEELKKRLADNPRDGQALGLLLEFLVEHHEVEQAHAAYASFVAADPNPKKHASYGSWLWRNKFTQEAITELTLALKGHDTPETHGYLGLALLETGKKKEAREEMQRALTGNADVAGLREKYQELSKELGEPVPTGP
jgi:tetratricopeptide (TPR) repeat protein